MARTRYQKGSLFKVKRKGGEVWYFRWREYMPGGQIVQHAKVIGSLSLIPSRTAAWKEVERLHLLVNNLSADSPRPQTFSELAEHYTTMELFDEKDPRDGRLAFSTKDTYRYYLRKWILPEWGKRDPGSVRGIEIENWLPHLEKAPGQKLAPATLAKIRYVMHNLYQHAIRYGWLKENPMLSVRQSAKRQTAPAVLSLSVLARLLFGELQQRERVAVFLDFATGMRRGELSGVKWGDIDFTTRELHIRRSIVKQRVGRVKTEASEKPVPLSDHLIAELLLWRGQTAYAKQDDYVFASHIRQGRQPYWMSRLMQVYIKPAAQRIGIQHLKGWHTLRHTYATLLKANGNDPKVVQGLLRHANFYTTMNLYTQAVPEQQRRAHDELLTQLVTAPGAGKGGREKFWSLTVRAGVPDDDARQLKRLGVPDGI